MGRGAARPTTKVSGVQYKDMCHLCPRRVPNYSPYRQIRDTDDGTVSPSALLKILARQKRRCAICGTRPKKPLQIDHIIPLAWGGRHTIANIQYLCPFCNGSKNDKLPDHLWAQMEACKPDLSHIPDEEVSDAW